MGASYKKAMRVVDPAQAAWHNKIGKSKKYGGLTAGDPTSALMDKADKRNPIIKVVDPAGTLAPRTYDDRDMMTRMMDPTSLQWKPSKPEVPGDPVYSGVTETRRDTNDVLAEERRRRLYRTAPGVDTTVQGPL